MDGNEALVTGVLKDIPSNSYMKFDFLAPFSRVESAGIVSNWHATIMYTYIETGEGVDSQALNEKMKPIGAIYTPLHRLEKKKLVRSFNGDPVPERGGRSKVFYLLTSEGKKALLDIKRVHTTIWDDIPELGLS